MCFKKWNLLLQRENKNQKYKYESFGAFFYSIFLFDVQSKKGCKYFEHCLTVRPMNGYLHLQYSKYLCQIIHDYKLSIILSLENCKKIGSKY